MYFANCVLFSDGVVGTPSQCDWRPEHYWLEHHLTNEWGHGHIFPPELCSRFVCFFAHGGWSLQVTTTAGRLKDSVGLPLSQSFWCRAPLGLNRALLGSMASTPRRPSGRVVPLHSAGPALCDPRRRRWPAFVAAHRGGCGRRCWATLCRCLRASRPAAQRCAAVIPVRWTPQMSFVMKLAMTHAAHNTTRKEHKRAQQKAPVPPHMRAYPHTHTHMRTRTHAYVHACRV